MTRNAGDTGPGAMSLVAMEQVKFPAERRVLEDDLAWPILPLGMRTVIRMKAGPFSGKFIVRQAEKRVPGLWGSIMCRKRYIDDRVSESVVAGEVEAVVNLGAGFDTRAYRLPALEGVRVFELDQMKTIADKRARLKKLRGKVPAHVTLVPVDFDLQDPLRVLEANGWKAGAKTFFILEGVTQYLTEVGLRSIFELLAGAAPGSRLIFTYICRRFLEGKDLNGQDFLYNRMVIKDRIWLTGLLPEAVHGFVDGYGWSVLEHPGYEELAEAYIEPTGRRLQTMSIERLVYAAKS